MPDPDKRSALIVHAHPEPCSFTTAQMQAARQGLTADGWHVDVIDLYAERWQPVLAAAEFPGHGDYFKPQAAQASAFKTGTLTSDVTRDLERLLAADLLVLSFPVWWFSLPAIAKGWIDRVFVSGGIFGGDLGLFDKAALHGRQAIVLATTGGSQASFSTGGAFGAMQDFLFPIHRGVLQFVGYQVLDPVITYGPARITDDGRQQALHQVETIFRALDSRAAAEV